MLQTSRKAEAKMNLLHEVIKRVQAGEDVDVRRELGTGDPAEEKEWEDGESSSTLTTNATLLKS